MLQVVVKQRVRSYVLRPCNSARLIPAEVQSACGKAQDVAAHKRLFFWRCSRGDLDDAVAIFREISRGHILVWNAIIQAHLRQGSQQNTFVIFNQMMQEGIIPNKVTFASVLSACAVLLLLWEGMRLHACIHCSKLSANIIVNTALIDMHGKCGHVEVALQLFESLLERDVVVFNTVMTSLLKHEVGREIFLLFEQMLQEGVMPSRVTYITVVEACAILGDGGLISCRIISSQEYQADVSLGNALIHMHGRCNHPAKAQQHFSQMQTWDAISWNTLMGVYFNNRNIEKVLDLFVLMQEKGFPVDECTYTTLVSSCASVKAVYEGMCVHLCAVHSHMESNVGVSTALLSMYGRCGRVEDALRVFYTIRAKTVISWNAVIALFTQQDKYEDAVRLLCEMMENGMQPDKVTFVHVVSACTHAGLLAKGKCFCLLAFKFGYQTDTVVGSPLVNMYGMWGELEEAHTLFLQISNPNVRSWNVVLKVYACHANDEGIFRLFTQMQDEGFVPDDVTFVAVLSGCDHLGHIAEGVLFFKFMKEVYGIVPGVAHHVCMIDLLGRAGQLEEAARVTDVIPVLSDDACITALASAYHCYLGRQHSTSHYC